MVETSFIVVVLFAVKAEKLVVPDAGIPTTVLEFVQFIVAPAGVVVMLEAGIASPAQAKIGVNGFNTGKLPIVML